MNKKTISPSRNYNVLVAGHPMVVDVNRSVWNALAASSGFDVDLVVPKSWKSNLIKELNYSYNAETDDHLSSIFSPTVFFKGNGSLTFFNPISLWLILNKKKYDKILLTQETWSLSLLAFSLISLFTRNFRTKIDLWVCQNIKKKHLKWLTPFERLNCFKVDNILCCCSEIQEVIKWKSIEKKCRYFPFSFSAKQYHSLQPIGVFNGPLKLGYIGRLSEEKGMGLLEELCERLIKEELPFELHLAGSGPWQEKWQELAAKDQRIIFHGVLKHTEAYRFYEEIHAIVLPSLTRPFWKEQFGRVIIEATASGRAVIGSSSGAIPEVMKQVGMPFNFQEGDLEDLLKKVKSCYDLFLSSKMDDVLKRSQQLSFELYDHQSVAARAQDYLKNPEGNHGLITNSELSS